MTFVCLLSHLFPDFPVAGFRRRQSEIALLTTPHPVKNEYRMKEAIHTSLRSRFQPRFAGALAAVLTAGLLAACGTVPNDEPVPDGFYRVQPGDTLYAIARQNRRSVRELSQWNNLSDANQIEKGQVLRIRPPARDSAANSPAPRADRPVVVAETPRVDKTPPARLPANAIRLQWPADGKVTGKFAPPSSKGILLQTQAGGAIKAAAPGRVIHVGTLRGYGMLVILKHEDDWLTVYGNLGKPSVKEGGAVSVGQEVGRMGSDSGELHFEVRGNGKPIDPLGVLPSRG